MNIQNFIRIFDNNRLNAILIMLGFREFSDKLRQEFDDREAEMKADFAAKMAEIKRKSAEELSTSKAEMIAKLKANYGELHRKTPTNPNPYLFYFLIQTESNYEKFKADKEEEQLDLQRNYKRKLSDADVRIR